jgi:hypothetical protein
MNVKAWVMLPDLPLSDKAIWDSSKCRFPSFETFMGIAKASARQANASSLRFSQRKASTAVNWQS